MSWKKSLLICGLIIVVGAGLTAVIFSTEPKAKRETATKQTAMLVDVAQVERGTFHPTIVAMGTVTPEQDIILSPRVSGEVVERSPAFTPGGFVQEGEVLLQIDPSDYENTLEEERGALHQAEADLAIEMGRQDVARQDYRLLDEELSTEDEDLVLRKPQLNAARARVEAARAAVRQAELDLARTTIRAPFDAHILSRNANVGSQVAPGDNLGRLVGIETYWVEATVPLAKLRWLTFPDSAGEGGSEVRIRNRSAWEEGVHRTGHLTKLVGALENQTRLARVLVAVPDPLAYKGGEDRPPMMIGSFVETLITGKAIPDVIRLDRDYIRKDDTVWVMEDGKLRIRNPKIVFRDAQHAYIESGLAADARVVTTNLATVTDGAPLRLAASDTTAAPAETPGGEEESRTL
ncbi:MAG: efflux RND transporter periplasmic adaptor subunit [Candidatus Eisenbacteria bacterium]|nr:efflux RND transporter periplasmic adaptor subunit [Candidatus Eisenbacteria bacterium]